MKEDCYIFLKSEGDPLKSKSSDEELIRNRREEFRREGKVDLELESANSLSSALKMILARVSQKMRSWRTLFFGVVLAKIVFSKSSEIDQSVCKNKAGEFLFEVRTLMISKNNNYPRTSKCSVVGCF